MSVSYLPKWDVVTRLNKMALDSELFGSRKKAKIIREVIRFLEEDVEEYVSDVPLGRKIRDV